MELRGFVHVFFWDFLACFFNFVLVYVWSFLTCADRIGIRLIVFTLWYLSDKYFDTTDQFELIFKHIFVSKHPNNAKKFCFQLQEITFAVQMDFLFQINTVDVLHYIYIYFYNLIQDKYIKLISICVFYSLFFSFNPDNRSHVKQVWLLQPLCCCHLLVHASTASKSMDPLNGQKYMDALMLQPYMIVEYLHPWKNCLYIKAMKDWEKFPPDSL